MNKRLLVFVTTFFLMSTTFAQFSVGPRATFNMADQTGSLASWDNTKSQWIFCFNPGIAANYTFSGLFSLQMEINYGNTGSKTEVTFTDDSGYTVSEGSIKMLYRSLQVPLLGRFTFGDKFRYFAELGPYFDLILDGKYKLKINDDVHKGKIKIQDDPGNGDDDVMYIDPDTRRKTDVGMFVGAGALKKMGKGTWVFSLRYGMGFLDTYKWDGKDKPDGYKPFKNRMVSISLAYMFRLGK